MSRMRINPDVRQEVETENAEYMKAKATTRLMAEIQKGWDSITSGSDWVSEDEAYGLLGVEEGK